MNNIHPKVSIPALGGAVVGIGIYEAKRHGIEIDAVEGSYLTLIVTTVMGFLIPSFDQPDVVSVPPGSTALVETPAVASPPQTAVIRERSEPSSSTQAGPTQPVDPDDILDIPPRPVQPSPTV